MSNHGPRAVVPEEAEDVTAKDARDAITPATTRSLIPQKHTVHGAREVPARIRVWGHSGTLARATPHAPVSSASESAGRPARRLGSLDRRLRPSRGQRSVDADNGS